MLRQCNITVSSWIDIKHYMKPTFHIDIAIHNTSCVNIVKQNYYIYL